MLGQRPYHQQPGEGGDISIACLLCLAANCARPTPLIDAVTALALAADDTLRDRVDPKAVEDVVSRLLALSDAEAWEILAAVPEAVRDGCGFTGGCAFVGLALAFLSTPRFMWGASLGPCVTHSGLFDHELRYIRPSCAAPDCRRRT